MLNTKGSFLAVIIGISIVEWSDDIRWEEVQERFTNEWVGLEVIKAHSDNGYRYIEDVVIIDSFENALSAMNRYEEIRKKQPHREYCFFHTSRKNLMARERYAGIQSFKLKNQRLLHNQ